MKNEPNQDEKVVAKGRIFELVQLPQPDGRVFEVARRAPGVRVIIFDEATRRVLLSREYRREIDGYDYRLPGGKVFDTLDEFEALRNSGEDMHQAAEAKAREEVAEEVGLHVRDLRLHTISTLGTTVEWDLYVFETTSWSEADGQNLGAGEDISAGWYGLDDVRTKIMNRDMQEERIALILLRWIDHRS